MSELIGVATSTTTADDASAAETDATLEIVEAQPDETATENSAAETTSSAITTTPQEITEETTMPTTTTTPIATTTLIPATTAPLAPCDGSKF